MSAAFLALWNDYPAKLTEEYEAWHTYEHVPERLTTPGMLWARRYGDFAQPDNHYFTLYALEDLQTLENPAYLDLVRRPTEWSFAMRQHFLNVLRIPATSFASSGNGLGGGMIVQAYCVDKAHAASGANLLATDLRQSISAGTILGFRIGLAEPNQPYEVFQQADVTDENALNVVLMVEGTTRNALEKAHGSVTTAALAALKPQDCLRDGLFSLLVNYQAQEFAGDRESLDISAALRSRFMPAATPVNLSIAKADSSHS